MPLKYVKFQRGTVEAYKKYKLEQRLDSDTLYFIYDESTGTGSLYMGDKLISGSGTASSLNDLIDVVVEGAETNSFLVKDESGKWVAKTAQEVAGLIGGGASKSQVFQVEPQIGESHEQAITRITGDTLLSTGDIVIVKDLIVSGKFQHTAYVYKTDAWVAMDGNYNANNIFTPEDIQVTTAVGELAVNSIVNAGTSFADLMTKMLSKSKNPTKTNPSISAFTVTNNGSGTSFEAGTSITPKWATTFNAGAYTYKSTVSKENIIPVSGTGVTATNYAITKDTKPLGDAKDGTGEVFILGDSPVNFKVVATYSDGNYALTNLNKIPEPEVRITAGSAEKTAQITSYRKMFAGGTTSANVDSNLIRGLSNNARAATTAFEFKAKIGDTKLVFAYPASLTTKTPKFEYFTMAWESVGGFVKGENIQVADARGGANGLKEYVVYTYTPAAPYQAETKYRVSF